jgi:hypothetical protein
MLLPVRDSELRIAPAGVRDVAVWCLVSRVSGNEVNRRFQIIRNRY